MRILPREQREACQPGGNNPAKLVFVFLGARLGSGARWLFNPSRQGKSNPDKTVHAPSIAGHPRSVVMESQGASKGMTFKCTLITMIGFLTLIPVQIPN
jgi:hypothetical protein